ncbi:uncharacterized protein [Pocillopora verrucosa]|uniref:uncharacterized protein isoform X3 n=1 Tax=Pocillopora verrucosa TaxID=203993 RepID=UPI00333F20DF
MVIIQPTGGVTTTTPAYPAVALPQVYAQQQVHPGVTIQQPGYWAVPPGSNPAGTVTVTHASALSPQIQTQIQSQHLPYLKTTAEMSPYSCLATPFQSLAVKLDIVYMDPQRR